MQHPNQPGLSVLIPVFNEAASLPGLHSSLTDVLASIAMPYEIIYCDDGSSDNSARIIRDWNKQDDRVKLIRLSRNFGKEYALSALIATARGKAMIMLDADGQHPVDVLPDFVAAWQAGAQVVVGICKQNQRKGLLRKLGSKLFYKLFNRFSEQQLPNGETATDYRLIDRTVQQAFLRLPETDRLTRGLIDWLGFDRAYVSFEVKSRIAGSGRYSNRALMRLAATSFVSSTQAPLYIFSYIGIIITIPSFVLGCAVLIEQIILEDPLGWDFTGTAMLGILLLFMVGIVLMSQGILALYISHINRQTRERPLYIIDYSKSAGISAPEKS
jgi:polyisoprenyl-phosphate glycosyltransferase